MKIEISLANDYEDLPQNLPEEEKKKWIFQRFVKDHYRAVVGIDENLGFGVGRGVRCNDDLVHADGARGSGGGKAAFRARAAR